MGSRGIECHHTLKWDRKGLTSVSPFFIIGPMNFTDYSQNRRAKPEILYTKVTYLGKGLYGCRVYNRNTDKPIVELRVCKKLIGSAFRDMLRTLDKLGWDSPMAHAARHRNKPYTHNPGKYIWNP